jgi:3-deoxy-manno-octulosonate cytidylyltransferase (CMP-KDO synthetase)
MKTIAIIPVRMGSSRFPGKPLAKIHGIPMVEHCLRRAELAACFDRVCIATCDVEIAEFVNSIGGEVVMTADTHTRATTRTAEAVEILEKRDAIKYDVVVMVQGDEALIAPETIAETIPPFDDAGIAIVNIMSRLQNEAQFRDHNNVKVVVNKFGNALYFSREPIPSPWKGIENNPMFMQTGIIAFRKSTLAYFNSLPETLLEQIESVDMNRVIENGDTIRMVLTDKVTIGIDTPEELAEAERIMADDPVLALYQSGQD